MLLNHHGKPITYQAKPQEREVASNRVIKALAAYDPGRLDYHDRDPLVRQRGLKVIEEMMEDPQVQACMLVLRWSVIARGYSIQPADTPAGQEHADFIAHTFEAITGTIEDALGQLTSATSYGYALAEKVYRPLTAGKYAGKWGLLAIKSKKPGCFDFDLDEFDNVLGIRALGATNGETMLPLAKFVRWTWRPEFGNPFGTSQLRAAYAAWKRKQLCEKFEMVALDRFGMPTVVGKYPNGTSQTDQDLLFTVVKSLQSDNAGIIPDDLVVELLEAKRQGTADFQGAIGHYNTEIALAILGQSLATNQNEKTGSLAQAEVHQDTLKLVLGMVKRGLEEEVLGEQIVRPLIDVNFGAQEAYPRVVFGSLDPQNEKEIAETAKVLVEAQVPPAVVLEWLKDRLDLPEVDEVAPATDTVPPTEEEVDEEQNAQGYSFQPSRTLKGYEAKVDFSAVVRELDGLEADALAATSEVIRRMRADLERKVASRGLFGKGGDLDAILKLQVRGEMTGDLRDALESAIKRAMLAGRESGSRTVALPYSATYAGLAGKLIDWIKAQATLKAGEIKDSLLGKVKQRLILSVQQDLSETQAMALVGEIFDPYLEEKAEAEDIAKAPRLRNLVRTTMTDAYNQGLLDFYENETDGFVPAVAYSAVMDHRTTPLCRAWDGVILRITDPMVKRMSPPNHHGCRSIWVPLTRKDVFQLTKDLPRERPMEGFCVHERGGHG